MIDRYAEALSELDDAIADARAEEEAARREDERRRQWDRVHRAKLDGVEEGRIDAARTFEEAVRLGLTERLPGELFHGMEPKLRQHVEKVSDQVREAFGKTTVREVNDQVRGVRAIRVQVPPYEMYLVVTERLRALRP